jgi:hypothetical protein
LKVAEICYTQLNLLLIAIEGRKYEGGHIYINPKDKIINPNAVGQSKAGIVYPRRLIEKVAQKTCFSADELFKIRPSTPLRRFQWPRRKLSPFPDSRTRSPEQLLVECPLGPGRDYLGCSVQYALSAKRSHCTAALKGRRLRKYGLTSFASR